MRISNIQLWDFRPPFRDGPYEMSGVSQSTAYGRIVRVITDTGISGLGEVVFSPYLSQQEMQSLIEQEEKIFTSLVGCGMDAMEEVIVALQGQGKGQRGMAFGMETAMMDILAKYNDQSLTERLGGAKADGINDYFSISERTPEKIKQRMITAGEDRKVIQLKIGIGSLEDDVDHVGALLDALSPEQIILADANGGWSIDHACRVIERFDDPRIVWEEPCMTYEENIEVGLNTGCPIMFDQCIGSYDLALRAIEDGVAGSVCIKPAFLGGLSVARRVRDKAAEAGVDMRIDGPWCGDIASAAILHLAVGALPECLIAGCDLREPMIIEPDLKGVRNVAPCRIAPPPGPGLGITASETVLGSPDAIYGL